ncbi:MAG: 23S rRNA (uracil(1939)-C(5))-methyltransferase RlmD [Candidatus Marinimicrobia bacterium]|nr:23S rRNA (uracil(1939)-C(5))-methyltransferase RlmD [Candidatus Neomarinimicrobiota bacterium]
MIETNVKKGQEYELTIESLAYGGKGIAKVNGFVVFVKNAIPGQKVRALVYRKRKGYAEARPLEVLEESPYKIEAPCEHFAYCGGCTFQQLDYEEQLNQKRRQVEELFIRQAGIEDFKVDEVIGADEIYHYRNKMEFSFSNRRWILPGEAEDADKDFALGLHVPRRYDKILDINQCFIQPELGNDILNAVKSKACELKLKPYDVKTHNGFLRHLVLRFGHNTGDVMVNLVTSYENPELIQPLADTIHEQFPQVTTIINNINTKKADIAYGEYETLLFGEPTITEKIGNLTFEISANSFFQTNTLQGEKLYKTALNGASLSGEEIVYDLYCGTGSISLFLAQEAKEVHGFEVIVSSIEDATRNAISNGITNVYFHKANLDFFFRKAAIKKDIPSPDVIVIDPPRAGMHKDMVTALPKFGAKRLVYISCNPTTQSRDIAQLLEDGYKLKKLTMVDMFPHTPHIETVGVLEKS